VRPQDVGIDASGVRRVNGLRREEVAALAGISAEYYLRLEQGRDNQPSDQVLNGLRRALLLDEDAAAYLHRLARPDAPVQVPQHVDVVDPLLVHLIDQWTTTPAIIISNCQDVLAINSAAAAAPQTFAVGRNLALTVFTDAVKQTSPDWEWLASNTIAALRLAASPADPRFVEIVEELTARDADFRRLWARHDAHPLSSGPAVIMLEEYGLVPVRWQNLSVAGNSRQTITVFFGEPGTPGLAALRYETGVPTLD
jgi:transcriptional regulator with XRE-family HTH domain